MSNLLDLVGNTPLVELTRLHDNPKVKIFGKLEEIIQEGRSKIVRQKA